MELDCITLSRCTTGIDDDDNILPGASQARPRSMLIHDEAGHAERLRLLDIHFGIEPIGYGTLPMIPLGS